jgi:hypothetical protein
MKPTAWGWQLKPPDQVRLLEARFPALVLQTVHPLPVGWWIPVLPLVLV